MKSTITRRAMLGLAAVLAAVRGAYAQPLSVGLTCVTKAEGEQPPNHFFITFTPQNSRWTEGESSGASKVFKTKAGTFVVVAGTTSLKNGSNVVCQIDNFNPSLAKTRDQGSGAKALETGQFFYWLVN